jgi:predicted dehydrogenase
MMGDGAPESPVRFALLGAAGITPKAFVAPAAGLVDITGIASRSAERGRAFASQHGIRHVYANYAEALEDPNVEAVYIGTPAALHAEWIEKAVAARKHVLCEKPLTLSEATARRLVDQAAEQRVILMEAHHSRFHPLFGAFLQAVSALPEVERVESVFDAAIAEAGNIRTNPALGAGVFLDFGCYLLCWMSWILESRSAKNVWDIQIEDAHAVERPRSVDRAMRVDLRLYPNIPATVSCSMEPTVKFTAHISVRGADTEIRWENPLALEGARLLKNGVAIGTVPPDSPTTYRGQLEAFSARVRRGAPLRHTDRDIVELARLMDTVYRTANLPGRDELARAQTALGSS